jgi:hemolysin activation/secretion protein
MTRRPLGIFCAFSALSLSAPAWAQDAADASRLEERLPEEMKLKGAHENVPASDVVPGGEPLQANPIGVTTDGIAVVAAKIIARGASTLAQSELDPIFAAYLNRKLSQGDLAALTRAVTELYRERGFFLSRAIIPPQDVQNGVLEIRIEEGFVSSVEVEGGGKDLEPYFAGLLSERPARLATLESSILTLGDMNGISVVRTRIAPPKDGGSGYRLIVTLKRERFGGQIYLDNRGEGGGDALQLSASARVSGLLEAGDRLSLNIFTDPFDPRASHFAQAAFSLPFGLRGSYATLSASVSASNNGSIFDPTHSESGSRTLVFALSHPLLRSREQSLWLRANFVVSDQRNADASGPVTKDALELVRFGFAYNARDAWHGEWRIELEATHGRDNFDAPYMLAIGPDPVDGTSFSKLTLDASRFQKLDGVWSLYAALRAQWTEEMLPESELISFGGPRWGRAYDYSAVEGDTGAAAQIELRRNLGADGFLRALQAYAFADWEAAWGPGGEGLPDTISSAGVGARATFGAGFHGTIETAIPVNRAPSVSDTFDPRLFLSLSKTF